jgi:hypothetical protein
MSDNTSGPINLGYVRGRGSGRVEEEREGESGREREG